MEVALSDIEILAFWLGLARAISWLVVERRLTMKRNSKSKPTRQKTKLGLPDLEQTKIAVIVSLRSFESQRSYRYSIEEFIAWYCSAPRLSLNRSVVLRYRLHLEDLYEYRGPRARNDMPPIVKTLTDGKGEVDFGHLRTGHYTLVIDGEDSFDVEIKELSQITESVTIDLSPIYPDCTGGHEST